MVERSWRRNTFVIIFAIVSLLLCQLLFVMVSRVVNSDVVGYVYVVAAVAVPGVVLSMLSTARWYTNLPLWMFCLAVTLCVAWYMPLVMIAIFYGEGP